MFWLGFVIGFVVGVIVLIVIETHMFKPPDL